MDVPLWDEKYSCGVYYAKVLIPLLVDDPLRELIEEGYIYASGCVLIPLLVDDPLRAPVVATQGYRS